MGDALGRCRARRRRMAGRRCVVPRRPRMRREPLRGSPARPAVRPRSWCPELRRGLRRHPPAPADGGAATAADESVLRARAGARSVVPRGFRLGTPAVVRGERRAAGAVRRADPGAWRLGGALLVADRGRRGARDQGRGRAVRHDVAEAHRGARPGCTRVPPAADDEQPRPTRGKRRVHAPARGARRHPQRPHDRPPRNRPVPGRRERPAGPRLVRAARPDGRIGGDQRRDRRHVLHRAVGAACP